MITRKDLRITRFAIRVERASYLRSVAVHRQNLMDFALGEITRLSKSHDNAEVMFAYGNGVCMLTIGADGADTTVLAKEFDVTARTYGAGAVPLGIYLAVGRDASFTPLTVVEN